MDLVDSSWLFCSLDFDFVGPEDPDDGKELKDVSVLHVGGDMGEHLNLI